MNFRPTYIRDRLTLWYIAIFSLVLGVYICGACFLQYWQLTSQLNHAAVQDLETVEGLMYFTADGRVSLHEEYHNYPQSRLLFDRMVEVSDLNGSVLFRNDKLKGNTLAGAPFPSEGLGRYSAKRMRLADGTHVLVISHIHSLQGTPLLIRLAYSTEPLKRRLLEFIGLLVLAMPIALVAAGVAGYRIAGKALTPLEEMARLTEKITANSLHERIPVDNPDDELGYMARVLNDLLQRLEESFRKLQRFTSDVSHELRTPLAAIRSVGEVGLQQDRDAEKYRDIIGSMLEEVARLTSMIDTLLTIAHAESGAVELHRAAFPLLDVVAESTGVVGVLAEDKKQSILVCGDRDITVWADRSFLRMAVVNLLDNAVKYSPPGSTIRVSLHVNNIVPTEHRFVELTIQDEGPGIPESDMPHIFDRFYRVDQARTREAGGVGLGLAIAKWAVEVHGGEIRLRSAIPQGSIFCVRLPVLMPTQIQRTG